MMMESNFAKTLYLGRCRNGVMPKSVRFTNTFRGFFAFFSNQLANLGAEQQGDRLQRLERSMLRLERVNLEILAMLQKLVASLRR